MLLVALWSSVFFGCGKSDSEKLTDELKQVASWTATAEMVADSYTKGTMPTPYTRKTLEELNRLLEQNADDVQTIPDERSGEAIKTVQQIQHIVSQMHTAASQQDRASLTQLTAQLAGPQHSLASFIKSAPNAK